MTGRESRRRVFKTAFLCWVGFFCVGLNPVFVGSGGSGAQPPRESPRRRGGPAGEAAPPEAPPEAGCGITFYTLFYILYYDSILNFSFVCSVSTSRLSHFSCFFRLFCAVPPRRGRSRPRRERAARDARGAGACRQQGRAPPPRREAAAGGGSGGRGDGARGGGLKCATSRRGLKCAG